VDGLHGSQDPRSEHERERLAKEWLLRMVERASLPSVSDLPLAWVAAEAPALIAGIHLALADPTPVAALELDPAQRRRAERLAELYAGADAPEQVARDLAALQALLTDELRRERARLGPAELARALERLAEVFGAIQGAVARAFVDERAGGGGLDELTGLPGRDGLGEWMQALLAQQRRYGHGFALAVIDIDGLARINDAYGREAGDRMVTAVAGVLRRQVRATDRAFRLDDDEFAILAPHHDAAGLLPMADRIAGLIEGSQAAQGPRIAIAAGLAGCPADGDTADVLLVAATEAIYAAKAAGRPVALSRNGAGAALQDP
jgi:diguanylate cyclase (GGDEF)-like protein